MIRFKNSSHFSGKNSGTGCETDDKFLVFIDDVEVVDYIEGISRRVGGVIRLEPLYKRSRSGGFRDSRYFSFKKLAPVLIGRPFREDREFDFSDVFANDSQRVRLKRSTNPLVCG